MYKQPFEFATFVFIWILCFLSSATTVAAFCSISVTVDGAEKSGDTIVVAKKTSVALECHTGGTLYREDEPYPSRFNLTESTQGSYHCRCSGGFRSSERILVVEPWFEDNGKMILTGFKGDNMTIPCGLTGTLQGVIYETNWERNYSRLPSERFREDGRDLVIENVTEEDTTYNYRCVVEKIGNSRLNGVFVHSDPRRIQLIESPVAGISHKVTHGEIHCSTQDSTPYPGDRHCLYVEDSGGERHEVECDDRPVSGDVEELMELGNTAVCTVSRTTTGSVPRRTVSNEVTHTITDDNDRTPPSTPSAIKAEVVVPGVMIGGIVAAGLVIVVVVSIVHHRRRNRPIVVKMDPETGNREQKQEVRWEEQVKQPDLSHDDIDSPDTRPPIPGCSLAESSVASTTSQRPPPVRHSHSQRNMSRHGNRSPCQYPPPKHIERPCHLWLSPLPAKTDLYPSLARSPVEKVHNYITPTRSKPHRLPVKSTPLGMCYTERTLPSPVKSSVSSPSPVNMAALPLPGNTNHRISSPAHRFNMTTPLEKSIRAESRLEDTHSGTFLSVNGGVERSAVVMTRQQTGNDTTASTLSCESPPSMYDSQSIGQYSSSSSPTILQSSSTASTGRCGSTGSCGSISSCGSTGSSDGDSITPVTSDKWWVLGGAHTIVVTSRGGEWSLSPFSGRRRREACCAVLTAPSGVVEKGTELLVEYCVILDGHFSLPSDYVRVSVAVYLNCDETLLRKPLKVKLYHWAAPDEEKDSHFSERLSFLKAPHEVVEGQDSHHFEQIEGAEFHTSTSTGILSLKDHFCLICIACKKSGPQEERINKRCYAMLWEGEVEDSIQHFRIVVMYAVPSWKQATREYYLSEKRGRLRYDEIRDFVFAKDCILHLETTKDKGKGWMLQQLRAKLYQDNLSLSDLMEMDREDKIHEVRSGLYPPAMIFDVGYNPPPPEDCGRMMSRANLQGVREDIGFSFAILDNPGHCHCSSERRSRAHRESTPKEYQLDPIILEDYVIPKMADKWKEFGIRLRIQNAMLDSIFLSNFGNTVNCCRAVLDHWMSSSSHEVSWDKVIQVMKDCERKLQASELEEYLSEKVSMPGSLSSGFEEC